MSYVREYKITAIDIVNEKMGEREVVCTLDNDTKVHITDCYESWSQWGGTHDELACTVDVADCINDWLHGIGEFPHEVYNYINA